MNLCSFKLVAASTAVFGIMWYSSDKVIAKGNLNPKSTSIGKNLAKVGDLPGAMEQARRLLDDLQSHNFDWEAIDQNLLHLPDQEFAQFEPNRGSWQNSFLRCKHAIYDEVAFYSDLYVNRAMTVDPGSEGTLATEGVYIVGWKDGRVTQVPAGEVRLYAIGNDSSKFVFPGMAEYSSTLPKFGN